MIIDWFWERNECHYCHMVKKVTQINMNYKEGKGWDTIYTFNRICKDCIKSKNKEESN